MDVQRKEENKSLAALLASIVSTVSQYSSYISGTRFSVNFFFVQLLGPKRLYSESLKKAIPGHKACFTIKYLTIHT